MSWEDLKTLTRNTLARRRINSEEDLDIAVKKGTPIYGFGKISLADLNANISKKVELVPTYTGKLYMDGMPKIEHRFVYCGEPDEYLEEKKKNASLTIGRRFWFDE